MVKTGRWVETFCRIHGNRKKIESLSLYMYMKILGPSMGGTSVALFNFKKGNIAL